MRCYVVLSKLFHSVNKNSYTQFNRSLSLVKTIQRPLILGIETSCDDTGAALIDQNGSIFGEALQSQQSIHLRNGGIIPPIAQELHRRNIEIVITNTFKNSNLSLKDIDAIAVTNRPGLSLSLSIGVRYAKYLARHYMKPLIPIHHMEAHALTARLQDKFSFPFLCLLCSGGHCILSFVKSVDEFYLLGETIDDAPGEAFDKIARRLKLKNINFYQEMSGGQAIEEAAKHAKNPNRFEFPLPLARQRDCQFSFAGIKNTARRHIIKEESEQVLEPNEVIPHYEDFCAGLLKGVARHICHRTQRAIEFCEIEGLFKNQTEKKLVFSGGVACNDFLYTAITQMAEQFGFHVVRPPRKYCTDNGVMIAWNGVEKWLANKNSATSNNLDTINIEPKSPFGMKMIKLVKDTNLQCKWVKIPLLRGE